MKAMLMHILITGAGGMLGRKLTEWYVREGSAGGHSISRMSLQDICAVVAPKASFPIESLQGDLSEPGQAEQLFVGKPDLVFHLAAIVSGEAEQDFARGWRINFDGTRQLLDAAKMAGNRPRVVFASSIAAFGGPFPNPIPDDFLLAPLTSYGAAKACGELMLADYSRKGFIDGVGLRLPTVVVRPGKPNKAASSFFSGIIREPLAGQDAICPVSPDVRYWVASPRTTIGFLAHAAELNGDDIGPRRTLSLPGLSLTVGDSIKALERVAGKAVADRIQWKPDPFIEKIVSGWPSNFEARRALDLGFQPDADFESIINAHIEDEVN